MLAVSDVGQELLDSVVTVALVPVSAIVCDATPEKFTVNVADSLVPAVCVGVNVIAMVQLCPAVSTEPFAQDPPVIAKSAAFVPVIAAYGLLPSVRLPLPEHMVKSVFEQLFTDMGIAIEAVDVPCLPNMSVNPVGQSATFPVLNTACGPFDAHRTGVAAACAFGAKHSSANTATTAIRVQREILHFTTIWQNLKELCMSLATEDVPFVHFSAKQKAVAWVSKSLFDGFTYTARHGLAKGMKRRGGLGWLPERFVEPDTREVAFLRSLDLRGKVVYDVGAFHGLMTLFFAASARRVIAFEPNPVSRKRLAENVVLNVLSNVSISHVALGSSCGRGNISWDSLIPGMASMGRTTGDKSQGVSVSTLDDEVRAHGVPDFIKIDTEGFESAVLRGAEKTLRKHHPQIFLEVHGQTMREKRDNATEIVQLASSFGYTHLLHVESQSPLSVENAGQVAPRGHIFIAP